MLVPCLKFQLDSSGPEAGAVAPTDAFPHQFAPLRRSLIASSIQLI